MDYFDAIDELNNIVEESNSGSDLLQKVNSSKFLNLEDDIALICTTLKLIDGELFNQFIEQLIVNGKIDLIKNNVEKIGIKNLLKFTAESKNAEFICEIFEYLMNKDEKVNWESIKPFMLDDKINKKIKGSIPTIIRSIYPINRLELMGIINDAKGELGNIEDYLADLFYVPEGKKMLSIENILLTLGKMENIDKIKLLNEVNNNFENIINSFDERLSYRMTNFLNTIKEIEDNILKDSEETQTLIAQINNQISNNFEKIIKEHRYNIDLIEAFRKFNIENSKFKDIQYDIIDELSGGDLIRYIHSARGNEGFDENWDAFEFVDEVFKGYEHLGIWKDKIARITISTLVQELCQHENIEINDIEFAGSGAFSFNVKIGDFVLKLAENAGKRANIPHHKRFLKPIVRQQNNEEGKRDIADIFLEVQNVVDTKWYDGLSEDEIKEQLYIIYRELRDDDIIWTDIKPENVGRLLKPNKENFEMKVPNENGEYETVELKSSNYTIGFTGEEPDEILGPGELVIIDLDFIYGKEDECFVPKVSYFNEFEERYQNEKKANNNINTESIKDIIKIHGYTKMDLGALAEETDYYKEGEQGKEEK